MDLGINGATPLGKKQTKRNPHQSEDCFEIQVLETARHNRTSYLKQTFYGAACTAGSVKRPSCFNCY